MKYALLIMYELRGVKKTIGDLYKYIVDFYDADIFILCQKQYDDDEERIKLFNRNVKFVKLYDKPNPKDYFNIDEEFIFSNYKNMSKKNDEYRGLWNTPGNIQICINLNEMAKVLKDYINDYDYYIGVRSDIEILFPFPDKELFNDIPNDIYGFYPNYCSSCGGIGEANIIHKNYILDYLTCCYEFIKNYKEYTEFFLEKFNFFFKMKKDTYDFIDIVEEVEEEQPLFSMRMNQEILLLLALQSKQIKLKKILNPNFFYTAETIGDYTTTNSIVLNNEKNKICKYESQLLETYSNSVLWEQNFTWKYNFEKITLINKNAFNITIDILIPNFNNGEYIDETLNSIFNQQTNYNYNILINDDGSSDDSVEIINKYIKIYPNKIRLFKNETNCGLFKTIMTLYEHTKSDYFTVLDSDDYWCNTNFIEHALNFLEANTEYSLYANNTVKLKNKTFIEYHYYTNTVCDIDINKLNKLSFIPHTSATIFRNIIFKENVPEKLLNVNSIDCESFRGDTFRITLHLDKAKGFLELGKISGVYRITERGLWNGLNSYAKNVTNMNTLFNINLYFDDKYKTIFDDKFDNNKLLDINKRLSMNEDSDNYDESICLYKVLIDYLETYNNKAIYEENFLFYDIENYEYKYNYIFIRILKLFKYLNKKIYKLESVDEGNNYSNILHYNIELNEKINIILPYNYDYNSEKINKNNVTIFYIGDFK